MEWKSALPWIISSRQDVNRAEAEASVAETVFAFDLSFDWISLWKVISASFCWTNQDLFCSLHRITPEVRAIGPILSFWWHRGWHVGGSWVQARQRWQEAGMPGCQDLSFLSSLLILAPLCKGSIRGNEACRPVGSLALRRTMLQHILTPKVSDGLGRFRDSRLRQMVHKVSTFGLIFITTLPSFLEWLHF